MTNSVVEIRCLGEFTTQGLAIELRGIKQVALMGYLASNLGKPCARETLVSIFWGDRFNDQARQSLRQALSVLRRAFQECPDALEIDRDHIRLIPGGVQVDVNEAELTAAEGDLDRAAKILRRGEFLAELNPKETGISEWLAVERAKWRELTRQTLLKQGEALLRKTEVAASEENASWLMRLDPLDEAAVRLAMRSKAATGELSEVAKLYRDLAKSLKDELGVEPAIETQKCFDQLRQEGHDRQREISVASNGAIPLVNEVSDVPTISIDHFDFAPDLSATRSIAEDLRDQLIYRLTKRKGIKVLDERAGLTDRSTYVLKGRLRVTDTVGRLNLSMILRGQSRTVFSQNYSGDTSDTFKFCDDLAGQAETHLRVQTNAFDGERLAHIPDDDLSVPELHTRAANLLHTGTVEGFRHAEQLMDRAVQLSPEDPTSLAMRANITIWLSMAGCIELSATDEKNLELDLNTALEGQHQSDYIYHVRGTYYACCKRDARATLSDGERALEINPNYALAYNTLGLGQLLMAQYDQAVTSLKKYVSLSENDPLLPARLFPLSVAQFCNGDYEDAEKTVQRAIGLKPNHRLFYRLRAMSLRAIGDVEEADAADHTADQLPHTPSVLAVVPPIHQDKSALISKSLR